MPQKISVSILISNPITGYGIKYSTQKNLYVQNRWKTLYTTTDNKKQYNIDIEI